MEEPSAHRPTPRASAALDPIRSVPDAEPEEQASPESARFWKSVPTVPESTALPEHVPPEQQAVPEAAQLVAARAAATESRAPNGQEHVLAHAPWDVRQPTAEDAAAARASPEARELPRRASLRESLSPALRPALPPSRRASKQERRLPAPASERSVPDDAKFRARNFPPLPRSRVCGPAKRRRRRASWSAFSCRQCPAPPTSRESRWALLRARGPAH